MKTFEEAFYAATDHLPTKRTDEQILAATEEYVGRFRELSEEVQKSKEFQGMLCVFLMKVASGQVGIEAAVFAVFMQGLSTGMEMEKQ